jgi:hypothetical protein
MSIKIDLSAIDAKKGGSDNFFTFIGKPNSIKRRASCIAS